MVLVGHSASISKVRFNGQGTKILTASEDSTARLWDVETGEELQQLQSNTIYLIFVNLLGHTDEIFSIAFNYESDTIITGSKDNTCIIWKDEAVIGKK